MIPIPVHYRQGRYRAHRDAAAADLAATLDSLDKLRADPRLWRSERQVANVAAEQVRQLLHDVQTR